MTTISPKNVPWTDDEWKIFAQLATNHRKNAPPTMALKCPELFIDSTQGYILNTRKKIVRHFREYLSNNLIRKGIEIAQDQSNIRIIAAGITPSISDALKYNMEIGTDENPVYVRIFLDTQSYTQKEIEMFEQRIMRFIGQALAIRGIEEPKYGVDVNDIVENKYGVYTAEDLIGKTQLPYGYRSKESIKDNPRLIHAWRSKHPLKHLLQQLTLGSSEHIQELYWRWLDGQKNSHVVPLNETLLREILPAWLDKFHIWSNLDIKSSTTLYHMMQASTSPVALECDWEQNFFKSLDI